MPATPTCSRSETLTTANKMVRKVVVKQLPPSSGRPKCVGSARLQLTGGGVFFVFVGFFFSLSFRCGSRGCSDDSVRRPRPATGPSRAPVHTHTHLHTHTHKHTKEKVSSLSNNRACPAVALILFLSVILFRIPKQSARVVVFLLVLFVFLQSNALLVVCVSGRS